LHIRFIIVLAAYFWKYRLTASPARQLAQELWFWTVRAQELLSWDLEQAAWVVTVVLEVEEQER
jgi:hypothetical protein